MHAFPNLNPVARRRSALFVYVAGVRTLFVDGVTQGASTTLTVPAGVSQMWLSGAGGGGGGGGGFASAGGGGGGGGAGMSLREVPVIVIPGSVVTISIGGSGAAGAIGGAGGQGGMTTIDGILHSLVPTPLSAGPVVPGSVYPQIQLSPGQGGAAGAVTNGGNGGGASFGAVAGGTGGAGAGGAGSFSGTDAYFFQGSGGGAGGAVNFSGGITSSSGSGNLTPGSFPGGGTGTATLGGGGNGGATFFSAYTGHGKGGNASTTAIAQPGVYGGGGGGGYGSIAGNRGGDGFALLTWMSPS